MESKKGKITVKHYCNKTLKPIIENGKERHPLYVQATFERKVFKFKSKETTLNYISETDLNNPNIYDFLKDEREDVKRTIRILSENEPNLINAKNIALFSSPLDIIIEGNFSRFISKEVEDLPFIFKNATYKEITEVLFFLNSYLDFEDKSENVNNCMSIISNLNYPQMDFFDKRYLGVDFYTGDKYKDICEMINKAFDEENPKETYIKSFRTLINS